MVRYIGLDVSSVATGVAVVDRKPDGSLTLVAHDVITTSSKQEIGKRLVLFAETLQGFFDEYQPDYVIREETINNRASNAILFKFLGVAQFLARNNGHQKTYEYYPTTIKKSVTGTGRASKETVAANAQKYFREDLSVLTDDETDAIAAILTHLDKTSLITTIEDLDKLYEHEAHQNQLVEEYENDAIK